MTKILITDRFQADARAHLSTHFLLHDSAAPTPTETELQNTMAMIIRSRTKISAELLALAPKLKVIVTCTSGFDHIDLEATQKREIVVMQTPEGNAASACEQTWSLILACCRRTLEAYRQVKSGDWNRESILGLELSGRTLGVVGLGRIGKRVAKVARAFDMKVLAYDPYIENSDFEMAGVERISYDELLIQSDILTFHVPLTSETRNMLNESHYEYLQRGAIIINASRGGVINEMALGHALEKGWITAAGLDVFAHEPLARYSPLLKTQLHPLLGRMVLTPHIGANTDAAFAKVSWDAAEKIIAFFSPQSKVSDAIPPQEAWYTAPFKMF